MTTTKSHVFQEGLIAGVLGYAAVAIVFVVLNVSQGLSPVFTPGVMGRALLGGGGLDPVSPWAGVLAFNALHLGLSMLIGLVAAFLAQRAEDDHDLAMGLVFFVMVLGGFIPILSGTLMVELLHALKWSEAVIGSLAGAVAALGYLGWAHRKLVVALFREAEV
jgi:hypothetical protein